MERWQQVKAIFQAAVDRPAGERDAAVVEACVGDASLERDVRRLLTAHDEAGDFLSSPVEAPFNAALAGRRVGPYRVLDEIGRGGMGVVYRAAREDEVFTKTVALKVVHVGAGPQALRRFARERRILAQLQHPNVATILDGGSTDEGQPYLVMEHVEGQRIDAYCERRGLGVTARLRLIQIVCQAVQYAHQNLVVHRDLKPANILVTADDQPKLLDFGIAKVLAAIDPDDAETATVMPVMTPAYASPEQLRGLPVSTASDVYALGVVAYELLTGRLPFPQQATFDRMVHEVCEAEPPPPSATAPELRGDLDTILLKALRKDPARRYLSAQELADDIGRYLSGRPVRARKDTLGYRLSKFLGRHRWAVAVSAAVVLLVAGGVVEIARQARIAQVQRLRAEKRFADVRLLANSFLFEVHDAIKELPGSTKARALLLGRGLDYLDGLAKEAGGDEVVQRELATAYEKVGEVQGSPFGASLGDTAGAIESSRKAAAIRQALWERHPDDVDLAVEHVNASCRLALLEDERGQTEAALTRAVGMLAVIARRRGEPRIEPAAAEAHRTIGKLLFKTGDQSMALEHQRRALGYWQRETEKGRPDARAHRFVYLIEGDVARSLVSLGAPKEALAHYRAAMTAAEARLALEPAIYEARRDVNISLGNLAVALHRAGQRVEAAAYATRALAFDEERLRADADDAQAQRNVSWGLSLLAQLAFDDGRFEEALGYMARSQDVAVSRVRADPTGFQARKDVAEGWSGLAEVYVKLDRLDDAAEQLARSVADFERLHADNPTHTRVIQLMADVHGMRGELYEKMAARARGDGAAVLWREARAATLRSLELFAGLADRGALDAAYAERRLVMAVALARQDAAFARLAAPPRGRAVTTR